MGDNKPDKRDNQGRFVKGHSGGTQGGKHKLTRFVEQVTEAKSEEIIGRIIEAALSGDTTILSNFQKVFWSPKRGDFIKLKELGGPNPMQALLSAVANGKITDIQAANLARVVQTLTLEQEINIIKQQIAELIK